MEDLRNEKLFDEMDSFISENDTVTSNADDDGLPFEPYDSFSTDPVGFEEMAERMTGRVETLFDLTRVYNRHSQKYLKAFTLLERGIRQLGSVLVTRAAMKEYGSGLPGLGQMTPKKLYGMASFNYRKLDAALTEKVQQGNDLYPELTDAFFRCFTLMRRLRATERKIYQFFTNKYFGKENEAPAVEGLAFSAKSWSKRYTEEREEAPAFRGAPAYPVIMNSECRMLNSEKRGAQAGAGIREPGAGKSGIMNEELGIRDEETPGGKETAGKFPEIRIQNPDPAGRSGTADEEIRGKSGRTRSVRPVPAGLPAPTEKTDENHDSAKIHAHPEIPADRESPESAPRTGDHKAADLSEKPKPAVPFGGNPSNKETPACVEIVRNAMKRGPASGNRGIAFTNTEILTLAEDPLLDRIFPDMAGWVKQTAVKIRGDLSPSANT